MEEEGLVQGEMNTIDKDREGCKLGFSGAIDTMRALIGYPSCVLSKYLALDLIHKQEHIWSFFGTFRNNMAIILSAQDEYAQERVYVGGSRAARIVIR